MAALLPGALGMKPVRPWPPELAEFLRLRLIQLARGARFDVADLVQAVAGSSDGPERLLADPADARSGWNCWPSSGPAGPGASAGRGAGATRLAEQVQIWLQDQSSPWRVVSRPPACSVRQQ